jgi:crossover junction endodeoxyribonuclease RusA
MGNGIMVEASKRAKPWRQDVMIQSRDQYDGAPLTGPVFVEITFWLPRPQSHYRMIDKQLSNVIKANAPVFSTASTQGDIDKVLRCSLDGLQAKTGGCVLADDSLVVRVTAEKRYVTEAEGCGALISVLQT